MTKTDPKKYITYRGHYRIPTTGLEKIRYLIDGIQYIFCHDCGFIFPIDLLGFAEHSIYHTHYCTLKHTYTLSGLGKNEQQ